MCTLTLSHLPQVSTWWLPLRFSDRSFACIPCFPPMHSTAPSPQPRFNHLKPETLHKSNNIWGLQGNDHDRAEVIIAVVIKSFVLWDIMPFSTLNAYHLLHAGFLLDLFFDPKDRDDMSLRNVVWLSTDYKALCPSRQNSSKAMTITASGMCVLVLVNGSFEVMCCLHLQGILKMEGPGSSETVKTNRPKNIIHRWKHNYPKIEQTKIWITPVIFI
jgi:hypothetical protein